MNQYHVFISLPIAYVPASCTHRYHACVYLRPGVCWTLPSGCRHCGKGTLHMVGKRTHNTSHTPSSSPVCRGIGSNTMSSPDYLPFICHFSPVLYMSSWLSVYTIFPSQFRSSSSDFPFSKFHSAIRWVECYRDFLRIICFRNEAHNVGVMVKRGISHKITKRLTPMLIV